MPSTTSSAVSVVLDSSTVITPSLPTLSMASATSSPIAESLCAEMAATCAVSLRVLTGRDSAFGRPIEAALDVDCARPRHHVPHTVGENGMRQNRRGAGSIANHVAGLL